jgi:beta-lactamase regulating signal transducer with metallopeptidase domain
MTAMTAMTTMTTLAAWLWDGLILSAGTALLLHCTPRLNAATRYAIWGVALFVLVALPVIPLVIPLDIGSGATLLGAPLIEFRELVPPSVRAALVVPTPPAWLSVCAIVVWLGSVALGLGRIVSGVREVGRLKSRARPVDRNVVQSLRAWTGIDAGRQRAVLCSSSDVSTASALGLFGRPTIVVSPSLLNGLDPESLDQIVLHEQAHLSRRDDWACLLQQSLLAIVGLHPAARFISARLDLEREVACDDIVVAITGAARRYAECLTTVAEGRGSRWAASGRAPVILSILGVSILGARPLLARVQRLLDARRDRRSTVHVMVVASVGLVLCAGVTVGRQAMPRVTWQATSPTPQALASSVVLAAPVVIASGEGVQISPEPGPEPAPARREPARQVRRQQVSRQIVNNLPRAASSGVSSSLARSLARGEAAESHSATFQQAVESTDSWTSPEPLASTAWVNSGLVPDSPASLTGNPTGITDGRPSWADIGASWRRLGTAGASVGRGAARFGVATKVGTQQASVAVGTFFRRAGMDVADGSR